MTPDIDSRLADIDNHVERIAVQQPLGSDLNILAHAIHNLIGCIRDMHDTSAR